MQQIFRFISRDPAWLAVFVGLFISLVNVLTDDVINSDGILYSEVTAKFIDGDWQGALTQFSWPFYPLLLSVISKISFLDFEVTAKLVSAGLLALLAFMFVRISQLLGGDRLVMICAAVLLLTNITLNDYRDLIIRDHGYWAFFFTAVYFFLQYYRSRLTKYALGFGFSMLIAIAFRVEGIVFAVLAPTMLLFQQGTWRQRLYQYLVPMLPLLAVVSAVLVVVLLSPALIDKFSSAASRGDGSLLGPLKYFQTNIQGLVQSIIEKGNLIEEHVLDINARNMGTKSVIAIMIMTLVVKVISAAGYINILFSVLAGFNSRIRESIVGINVIAGFMLINLFVLIVVVTSKTFLTPRYAMSLALLISLTAAFSLADFLRSQVREYSKWRQRGKVLLIVVLAYMFLDGLISTGSSKAYLRESGLWLKNNAPAEARLFSNEESLYYYSGRKVDQNSLVFVFEQTRFSRLPLVEQALLFDYVAIKVGRKQKGFEQNVIDWMGSKPIHRDGNKSGDAVLIFKVKK